MNFHDKNIKLTVESNRTRFLDTDFNVNPDGSATTNVFHKPGKFLAFWILKHLKGTRRVI